MRSINSSVISSSPTAIEMDGITGLKKCFSQVSMCVTKFSTSTEEAWLEELHRLIYIIQNWNKISYLFIHLTLKNASLKTLTLLKNLHICNKTTNPLLQFSKILNTTRILLEFTNTNFTANILLFPHFD